MLQELSHMNIVKFYDALTSEDGVFIFLEYISQVRFEDQIFG
jgi:hypothetical protein